MASLIIKNGIVYDPANGIDGEKKDIFVKDGKIVENVDEKKAEIIDANNKVVMPGGVDSHSHIAGAKVNTGRIMRPEDSRRYAVGKGKITRSGTGDTVPTVDLTGYQYAQMGYTTVMEAAMPPLEAIHTHEEMMHIPIIDKGAYTVMGNNWFIMDYLRDGEIEKAAGYAAWLLKTVRGYGIKIVNPAGVEAWGWGKNVSSLDESIDNFDVSSREIIKGLAEVNELLELPMSIHLHANNLGRPGNYGVTVDSLKIPKGIKKKNPQREQTIYLAHALFNAYGGTSWRDFESGTKSITDYTNANSHVVIDLGAVPFGSATSMTGDGPAQFNLHKLTGMKWSGKDIELETGSGIVPFDYLPRNPAHSVLWAIGLELALFIDNPWQVIMTTDHPNGGPFTKYPKIIAWLMSSKAREDTFEKVHAWATERSRIAETDRELSLYEIAIITRATTSKTIGLGDRKGHLGIGADADISIYDINPAELNTDDYGEIEKKFSRAVYTIKDGEVVVRDGEIVKIPEGRTFWVNASVDEDLEKEILKDVKDSFRYYTVNFENYGVPMDYLPRSEEIVV